RRGEGSEEHWHLPSDGPQRARRQTAPLRENSRLLTVGEPKLVVDSWQLFCVQYRQIVPSDMDRSMTQTLPSLDDRYLRESGSVYLTGMQALVRLLMDQARADRAQAIDTGGFVSGY